MSGIYLCENILFSSVFKVIQRNNYIKLLQIKRWRNKNNIIIILYRILLDYIEKKMKNCLCLNVKFLDIFVRKLHHLTVHTEFYENLSSK